MNPVLRIKWKKKKEPSLMVPHTDVDLYVKIDQSMATLTTPRYAVLHCLLFLLHFSSYSTLIHSRSNNAKRSLVNVTARNKI